MIYIGIDPGTHTGLAVWDDIERRLLDLDTLQIHQALDKVKSMIDCTAGEVMVIFEDARQRVWFGANSNAKVQGAGSIKRDCSIWEDFCVDNKIRFKAVPPMEGGTKLSKSYFESVTGWKGRTSNHARDAAMLVIGR